MVGHGHTTGSRAESLRGRALAGGRGYWPRPCRARAARPRSPAPGPAPGTPAACSGTPTCIAPYVHTLSDSGFNEGGKRNIKREPSPATGVRYGHAPVEEAAAALVGGEVDRGGGGALLGGRRGPGGREGGGEALCGGGGDGGRGEHAAEVERAAEQRGRHGCLGGGREARGDSEIGRPPTASETGRTNVLDVAAGWPRTAADSLRAGP